MNNKSSSWVRTPWAYDLEGSRNAIEALTRYAADQGIIENIPKVEDLFYPTTMDEPPGYVRR